MVVAAGAVDGHAEEGLTDIGGDLGQDFLAAFFGIDIARYQMLGSGAKIAGGDQGFLIAGEHLVSRELLLNEAVERLVRVEESNDVVAISPGVRAFQVQLKTVGVGIADDIEPLAAQRSPYCGEASRRSTSFS